MGEANRRRLAATNGIKVEPKRYKTLCIVLRPYQTNPEIIKLDTIRRTPNDEDMRPYLNKYICQGIKEKITVIVNGRTVGMWVDENGISKGLPVNPLATTLNGGQIVVGVGVIFMPDDGNDINIAFPSQLSSLRDINALIALMPEANTVYEVAHFDPQAQFMVDVEDHDSYEAARVTLEKFGKNARVYGLMRLANSVFSLEVEFTDDKAVSFYNRLPAKMPKCKSIA